MIDSIMVKKFVIGIIGKPYGGKDTVAKLFTKKFGSDVNHVMFSGPLTAFLFDMGYTEKEIDRPLLQKLAQNLNKHFSEGTVTRGALLLIKNSSARINIVDGVRWQSDFDGIKALADENTKPLMVYVHTDQERRFERGKNRQQRAGEREMTWEDFLKQDEALNERFVEEFGEKADFKIDNNEEDPELKNLKKQVDDFCEKHLR